MMGVVREGLWAVKHLGLQSTGNTAFRPSEQHSLWQKGYLALEGKGHVA